MNGFTHWHGPQLPFVIQQKSTEEHFPTFVNLSAQNSADTTAIAKSRNLANPTLDLQA
jgi:hypothetical protein